MNIEQELEFANRKLSILRRISKFLLTLDDGVSSRLMPPGYIVFVKMLSGLKYEDAEIINELEEMMNLMEADAARIDANPLQMIQNMIPVLEKLYKIIELLNQRHQNED